MKRLMKKWWFWAILVSIVIILILCIIKKDEGVGENGISKQEFENIQLGMSQNDVIKIISPDNLETINEELEKSNNNSIYTYKYKYFGEKSGYAIITYEANYSNGDLFVLPEVTKKEQYNLK